MKLHKLLSIIFLTSWAASLAIFPTNISQELFTQNSEYGFLFWISVCLLIFSPFFKFLGFIYAQKYVEQDFIIKRFSLFDKYEGYPIPENTLFSQNAYLIKEGQKISEIDIPVFIIVIIFTVISSATKDGVYYLGLLLAIIIGSIAIVLSSFLSKLQLKNLQSSDEIPMHLYKEFTQSYPSLKFGVWRNLLNNRFTDASQFTANIWVRLTKISMLPGVLVESGTLISVMTVALTYWIYDADKLSDLFPLYFQITAITTLFLQISVQIPTLRAFRDYLKSSQHQFFKYPQSIKLLITADSVRIDANEIINEFKFLFGKIYLINGSNGSGKTTLLTQLSMAISEQLSLIFLNSKTSISFMKYEVIYSEFSDGQRQLFNLQFAISQNPKVLVLDEALSGLDNASLINATKLIKNYCLSGGLALMVEHGYLHANSVTLAIEDITKFRSSLVRQKI